MSRSREDSGVTRQQPPSSGGGTQDESKHPHAPAGTPQGGQFTATPSSGAKGAPGKPKKQPSPPKKKPTRRPAPASDTDALFGSGLPTLKEGKKGNDPQRVRQLQQLLHDLGLSNGPVDGTFGPTDTNAIKALQEKLGLKPTGTAGSGLLRRLSDARDLSPCLSKTFKPAVTTALTRKGDAMTAALSVEAFMGIRAAWLADEPASDRGAWLEWSAAGEAAGLDGDGAGGYAGWLAKGGGEPDLLKVGPHGYIHGWIKVGGPGQVGDHLYHPDHGHGRVVGHTPTRTKIDFDSGAQHAFQHGGTGNGDFVARTARAKAPTDTRGRDLAGEQSKRIRPAATPAAARSHTDRAAGLDRATSREEGLSHLDGMSNADLKEFAAANRVPMRGKTKPEMKHDIVEALVGSRLRAESMRRVINGSPASPGGAHLAARLEPHGESPTERLASRTTQRVLDDVKAGRRGRQDALDHLAEAADRHAGLSRAHAGPDATEYGHQMAGEHAGASRIYRDAAERLRGTTSRSRPSAATPTPPAARPRAPRRTLTPKGQREAVQALDKFLAEGANVEGFDDAPVAGTSSPRGILQRLRDDIASGSVRDKESIGHVLDSLAIRYGTYGDPSHERPMTGFRRRISEALSPLAGRGDRPKVEGGQGPSTTIRSLAGVNADLLDHAETARFQLRLDAGESPSAVARDISDHGLAQHNAVRNQTDEDRRRFATWSTIASRVRATNSKPDGPAEAARVRQARIDHGNSVAEALAKVDELRNNATDADGTTHPIDRAIADNIIGGVGRRNSLPADLVGELTDAAASGDPTRIHETIGRHAADHGLTRTSGPAGSIEPFDRSRHKAIGGGLHQGQRVEVVRPGYAIMLPNGKQQGVLDTLVDETDPPASPTGGAAKARAPDIAKAGPKGYIHGWIYVGPAAVGAHVHHPEHGHGIVARRGRKTTTVVFDNGDQRAWEHAAEEPGAVLRQRAAAQGRRDATGAQAPSGIYRRLQPPARPAGTQSLDHIREQLGTMPEEDLALAYTAIATHRDSPGKALALSALDAELARRENARHLLVDDDAHSRDIDDRIRRGWSYTDAYADVHGADPTRLDRDEQHALIDAHRRPGERREHTMRRMHAEHTALQYLQAEDATRGHMLTPEGRARGIDPASLWSGPADRARRYASDDLKAWWEDNGGRTSYAQFRAQYLGGAEARRTAQGRALAGAGRDYGI